MNSANLVIDTDRLLETHKWLNAGSGTLTCEAAVLFGRKDRRVAEKGAQVFMSNNQQTILVPTGGVGKDSGGLKEPEAFWLGNILINQLGIPWHHVIAEPRATNGGQNARYSLQLLDGLGLKGSLARIGAIIHATSAGRLAATLQHELRITGWYNTEGLNTWLTVIPTDYPFDPTNEADQRELVGEILRIALYGLKGMLTLPHSFKSLTRGEVAPHYQYELGLGRHFDPQLYDKVMAEIANHRA